MNGKKLLTIFICCVLAFSMAGCTKDDDDKVQIEYKYNIITENQDLSGLNGIIQDGRNKEDILTDTEDVDKKIDDYLAKLREQEKETFEKYNKNGVEYKVYANGRNIIFSYKYANTYNADNTQKMKDSLSKQVEDNNDIFTNLLSCMKTDVPEIESVKIMYVNNDGSVIYEKVYN